MPGLANYPENIVKKKFYNKGGHGKFRRGELDSFTTSTIYTYVETGQLYIHIYNN